MDDHQFQIFLQIMDRLKAVELAMARFYALCASAFPQDTELWDGLRRDEEEHARLVDELRQLAKEKKADYTLDKFNAALLNTYLAGIEDEIRRFKNGKIGRRQALSIAQDYERTLIERQFYNVVKGPQPEYGQISQRIDQETHTHFQKLRQYIQERFPA